MADFTRKELAYLWRDDDLEGLEILHASYVTHTFARHTHETFAIGMIEAGAGALLRVASIASEPKRRLYTSMKQ